jgi:hypothetical protein
MLTQLGMAPGDREGWYRAPGHAAAVAMGEYDCR